ncbi:hydroxymethylglutaryl-CoA reductase [Nocardia transvalensis]|uniref:hydroxymethylglutaryl-CoA reductase n=1 Tax=Nocardia transvalensis TaxID=37333 RepID=UPI001893F915|nr:hydroxymethylglutaryl-CoA reductase [Nocardia transvalensis]MBF6331955.1 hydroxymethylglutaryl-CoA reductase [Nocardia transvalensis]
MNADGVAAVPLSWIGPIRITGNAVNDNVCVPLATYESPLWPSVARGARVSRQCDGGVVVTVVDDRMTRSILLETDSACDAFAAAQALHDQLPELRRIVSTTSRFARLVAMRHQIVGNILFVRFEFTTGDAAGHNMVTLAAQRLIEGIVAGIPGVRYGSISGNYCTDKKASAVNGILGRGKNAIAEILVPVAVVAQTLHTTARRIVDLNVRKNLIGTTLAGGVRSANAHYANMLLAVYLATGQDGANIVEGSQGITHAEDRDGDLYFSCSLPNLIVGTTGNGKSIDFVEENLTRLGCRAERGVGENARRLAGIVAATVLCGELSLMAAQTVPGELMRAHVRMERSLNGDHK